MDKWLLKERCRKVVLDYADRFGYVIAMDAKERPLITAPYSNMGSREQSFGYAY